MALYGAVNHMHHAIRVLGHSRTFAADALLLLPCCRLSVLATDGYYASIDGLLKVAICKWL